MAEWKRHPLPGWGWEMRDGDLRARVISIRAHSADYEWGVMRTSPSHPDFAELTHFEFEDIAGGDTVSGAGDLDAAEEEAKRLAEAALRAAVALRDGA